ncbi:OmpH family outer membrane protein [Mangrovimonas aestuarii]|uniref:OmpH family outer membrane protein n=1 Tax=Mangrovimonas aestuarii TaxID=3018443 RepID=UPI0023792F3F|nr:OmpH family outer membrane protein [Mangrovimonas aestuarii]
MKQLKTLFIAAVLCIGAISFTQAQSKVAHINTTDLISAMPDMKAAQGQLEQLGKTYEADIQAMVTELQNQMKQYEAEAATKTDEENARRAQEVQTKEANIRQFQAQAQRDMQQKELDLLKPITEKAKTAILKVARAQGFDYVLDSTQGGGVIMADGKNLLDDVKKELGI